MNINQQAQKLLELVNKKNQEKHSKFISIASGKGGVGKTNFAVNLSYILANKFEKKVLLIDADMGMADVHVILNLKPQNNLKALLSGKKPQDIVVNTKGFDVLPGFSGIDTLDDLEDFMMMKIINDLTDFSKDYDFVIIDTAAGIDNKVISFIRASSRSFVITTPEPPAMMDAYALMKSIYKIYNYTNFKLVINMCKNKNEALFTYDRLNNSFRRFVNKNIEMAGWIPYSQTLNRAIKSKKLISEVFPSDDFTRAVTAIASKEVGEEYEFDGDGNFWKKLMSFLKKE